MIMFALLLTACSEGKQEEANPDQNVESSVEDTVHSSGENEVGDNQQNTAPEKENTSSSGVGTTTEETPSENTGSTGNTTSGSNGNETFGSSEPVSGDTDSGNTGEAVTPDNSGSETKPAPDISVTYEQYQAMSGDEQYAYFNTFGSVEDFFAWYNAAKATYEKENPSIEIGGGSIDLGEIINGKNS